MPHLIIAVALAALPIHQHLDIHLDPATGMVTGKTSITVKGAGDLIISAAGQFQKKTFTDLKDGNVIELTWTGVFADDVAAGEKVGQIHNFSVNAHVSEAGVFLSDWAPWYPAPIDEDGNPLMRTMSLEVEPIEGWSFVGSGNEREFHTNRPSAHNMWGTPRPVDGMALVGNKHEVFDRKVSTSHGDVLVSVHLSPEHADKVDYYLEAASDYLHLYVPLLGKYPYAQFTIVENFFSSGFAYPGFTILGPRVVGMAPKSLAPGYLDHELVHNWWGNGVYVDRSQGNWCEALTSYCSNYGRRALEDGADAARDYRRGLLNKVSLDPMMDNGPLASFGSANPADGDVDRFVGYDKGAFVFMMLEDVINGGPIVDASKSKMWSVLARFAKDNMGRAATWKDIQRAAEAEYPTRSTGWLDPFFDLWVYKHTVPKTTASLTAEAPQELDVIAGDGWVEIDPDYRYYRLFPEGQLSPTIAGTLAGTTVHLDDTVDVLSDTGAWLVDVDKGANLLLIGSKPIQEYAELLAKCEDPIEFMEAGFSVGGTEYEGEGFAVLHTMNHPNHAGQYITIFYSVGESGWERLRFIWYYSKDTTVVWNGSETVLRRMYEPSGKLNH